MKTVWTQGLDPEVVKDTVSNFKGSLVMRKRLIQIIQDKSVSNLRDMRNSNSYESPSWAYLQADKMGYERALFEIIELLKDS